MNSRLAIIHSTQQKYEIAKCLGVTILSFKVKTKWVFKTNKKNKQPKNPTTPNQTNRTKPIQVSINLLSITFHLELIPKSCSSLSPLQEIGTRKMKEKFKVGKLFKGEVAVMVTVA